MLDAFIIEQLRKRERQQQEDAARPVLQLPLHQEEPKQDRTPAPEPKEEGERGVVIIDFA